MPGEGGSGEIFSAGMSLWPRRRGSDVRAGQAHQRAAAVPSGLGVRPGVRRRRG